MKDPTSVAAEARRRSVKAWRNKNPDYAPMKSRERSGVVKSQTPVWADPFAIRNIYKQARTEGLSVDHEIPLRGSNVCGFHVESNLRLISFRENSSKQNKF